MQSLTTQPLVLGSARQEATDKWKLDAEASHYFAVIQEAAASNRDRVDAATLPLLTSAATMKRLVRHAI